MADAFAPQLGSEVRFNQPVENISTATAISGLGNILGAFMAPKEKEAKGPMGSVGNPDVALSNYTKELSDIMATSEDTSPNSVAVNIRKLNVRYAGEGYDVTGPAFKSARESITGRQEETLIFSQEELVYNDLIKTPEGQAKLALAERTLMAQSGGTQPSGTDTINFIISQEAEKQAFERLKVDNEMSYLAAAPQFQMQVSNMGNQFLASLDIIEENGLRTDDPEMLQNSYLSYQAERNRIISKIPLGLPNREQEIKNLFQATDEFFASMGIKAGDFTRLSKDQLDIKRKATIVVEMLGKRPDQASALLAADILNSNYNMTPDLMATIQATLGDDILIDPTPEWVTDAGIVISNDMITVAQQLSAIGPQAIKTVADHEAALTGLVGADVAEKWAGLTSEQAWKDLQATTGIYKGFSREAILNGQVSTDIPYQMAFKLSMGLKTIDFENEPVSFGGLRKSVDASLPSTLDALEAKDPEKGKAARTLLYVATGKAARQYEAQIAAEEQRFGMSFNPRVRGYSLDYSTIADAGQRQIINRVVEEQYGGDIIKAVEDKFAKAGNVYQGRSQAALTGAMISALPSIDDMKRLLDLRNSAVYLDSLSRKIEPEDFRVAREMGMDAFSTTEAQAIGAGAIEAIATAPLPGEITTETIPAGGAGSQSVGSVTAQLLDKFEGGGDYDALFGFANREGGPFAGTKVSEMTIGELKDFSNGEYADYSRQQLGYKATPMGRFQFVGTTLSDVAKRMGLGDDTVFTPQVQNDMFIFLAKDVMAGKSASGKRTAMRQTWEGLRNASDAELNQMIAEIEGGKASFGTSGTTGGTFRGARPTEANAAAAAAGGAVQRAVASTPSASMTMPSGEAPTEAAAATLPEAIPTTTPENQAVSTPEGQAPVVDKDVQAFIQEIAGDPDKTFASDAEFLAAQERGELEAGDTVVVDGDIYVIRKNGTARRLGSVNA